MKNNDIKEENTRENNPFKKYLDQVELNKVTKRVYNKSLNDPDFEEILRKGKHVEKNIYEIEELEKFKDFYEKLKKDEKFIKLNTKTPSKGRYNFTSALKHYENYLKTLDINKKYLLDINEFIKNKDFKNEQIEDIKKGIKYLTLKRLSKLRYEINNIDDTKIDKKTKEDLNYAINKNICSRKISKFTIDNEDIIELGIIVEEILNLCRFNFKNNDRLIHYTTKHVARILFTQQSASNKFIKLRLNNYIHMNDPKEGELFKEVLIEIDNNFSNNKCKEDKSVENKSSMKTILDKIFEEKSIENRKVISKESNVYLTSFSKAIDKLPMWVNYGDNARGAGIILDKIFFYPEDEVLENKISEDEALKNDTYTELIQVKYFDKFNLINNLKNENKELLELLKKFIEKLKKIYEDKIDNKESEECKAMLEIIKIHIDNIRFIFKDEHYNYEEEIRLINVTESNLYDEINDRYYVNLEETLDNCSEIILGAKFENKNVFAKFLYENLKEKDICVTISSAEYR